MDIIKKKELERPVTIFSSRLIVFGFCIMIALSIAFAVVYRAVTNNIVNTNIQQMEELAGHDRKIITNSINSKWKGLRGVAEQISRNSYRNAGELFSDLALGKAFLGCEDLLLVAADGAAYHSTGMIDRMDDYYKICKAHEDSFIVRYDRHITTDTKQRELLLVGVKIQEFSVEEIPFAYLLMETNMDLLQDELAIDAYDGKGYGSIISSLGAYVVGLSGSHGLQVKENFLQDFADAQFSDGYTAESLLQAISAEDAADSISLTCMYDSITYIMVLSSIPYTDWIFLAAVPRSIFEEQSRDIVRIYGIMLAVILIAVLMVVIYILHSQRLRIEKEAKYHEELAEAYQMAQQASRAKTTFLNNMSHDIRTPMNAIIGYTALAAKYIGNADTVRDYLGKISQSSNHLLSLINDVLDMSRIESGRVNINESEESLSEILHNLRDIVQTDIHAKQLKFFIDTVDIADENILCDKLRLNQVLLNILSNAVKYTAPGGTISMRITETKADAPDRATYEFRVKDNGIGMSKEFAKTIFDPFTRESTSTVSGIQGTGLGMAITKNIVDMMGGTIVCSSTEHVGTEFIVTLDFKLQTEHKEIEIIKDLEGLRGLVVDDDMNSCQSISAMLRQMGMHSEWCMYGKEAVARTEEAIRIGDNFQVYIIDWMMADMNGVEAARRIRKIVGEAAPIIILTAYDWSDIEEDAKAAGVTDFVSKPLFPSDFRRTLMKACGSQMPEEVVKETPTIDFIRKRLLLVEDNALNQEIAIEILTEAGFLVETADNGQMACDILKEKGGGYYDLVLMDVQMPVMDGYKATKIIRQFEDEAIAKLPIIAMTANAFAEDRQQAKEAGMNGHVAKPIDIPKLFETLQEILK